MFRPRHDFSLIRRGGSRSTALAAFDDRVRRFAQHVESKRIIEGACDAARGAESTTQ
jgi:hypothetical protein